MSSKDAQTPRVYLVRHGETEWSPCGKFTGKTNLGLTSAGKKQISSTARAVGPGNFFDTSRIAHVFVSPMKRAKETLEMLLPPSSVGDAPKWKIEETEDIAEWNYGEYEGLTDGQIRERRKENGLDPEGNWSIWRDGCEGGESKEDVTKRLDRQILCIRKIQEPYMNGEQPVDVVLVSHGLLLRCFAKRWLNYSIDYDLPFTLNPGAIFVLSYQDNNINKPALHLGLSIRSAEEAGNSDSSE